ncbi:MAG: type IV pilin N-terminal domain-containing protein, partial [Candidatus Methanoperedens sp.]|nr:type IV pilin N-terminal domain-containing protein [Candidatus Methanoperedens sp.]
MFKENEDGVSPVIGTILMVAVVVILAAVIAVFVFGFGSSESKGPTSSIRVSPILDTYAVMDMKIQHQGGDRLIGGDWHLSIVPAGYPPVFRASSSDFNTGDMIVTTNMTGGTGNYTVTNSTVYSDEPSPQFISGGRYDVKIIVYPYQTMVLDTV